MGQTLDDETARDALTFVLSPEGSFFRDFLLDEIVKGMDAISRDQVYTSPPGLGRRLGLGFSTLNHITWVRVSVRVRVRITLTLG